MKRVAGVTLIELMIVVAAVGILAAIAYPSYRSFVVKSRRSDGQILLLQTAAKQEKYFSDCSIYAAALNGSSASCVPSQLGLGSTNPTSKEGDYILAIPEAGNINGPSCQRGTAGANFNCGFTLTANPAAGRSQINDGAFRIDAVGIRQWNKNNAGTWVDWNSR